MKKNIQQSHQPTVTKARDGRTFTSTELSAYDDGYYYGKLRRKNYERSEASARECWNKESSRHALIFSEGLEDGYINNPPLPTTTTHNISNTANNLAQIIFRLETNLWCVKRRTLIRRVSESFEGVIKDMQGDIEELKCIKVDLEKLL